MKISHTFKGSSGIYKITNTVNGKCYIGRTKCFYRRSYQYDKAVRDRNIKHINEYMLNSILKYGAGSFIFRIIEICDADVIAERENFWMEYFNSRDSSKGYNLRKDTAGGSMITHPLTSERISERLKKEWSSGIRDGHSEKLKVSWDKRNRKEQSELMSKNLTKYYYLLHYHSGETEKLNYSELKTKSLHGVLGKFSKYKIDKVEFKGFVIERIKIETV